jgi:hypothetical protein
MAREFVRHVADAGARLTLVEVAFGDRPFELADAGAERYIQLRTPHEYWVKEAAINYGVQSLPADAKYVAWMDADLVMSRPDWVQETLQQLQHHAIVQMFSEAYDLDPSGEIVTGFKSFGYSYIHGIPRKPGRGYYGGTPGAGAKAGIGYWHHPGFSWAARLDAFDAMGGLFDVAVVGEADYIMALGLVGEAESALYPGVSPGYRKAVIDWQTQALKLRRDIGYVPGTVLHKWHGKKAARKYWDRCRILRETQFDPTTDLKYDRQGIYQLVDHGDHRSILLRDSIRKYFLGRNEDSTEV